MLVSFSKIYLIEYIRAGVCRPYVETKLTATEKSATDGDWSLTTLGRHKRAYDRIQLVADSRACSTSQDAGDLSVLTTAINCISKVADQRKLSRHKLKLQLVAISSIVSQGRHTPALIKSHKISLRNTNLWVCTLWYKYRVGTA